MSLQPVVAKTMVYLSNADSRDIYVMELNPQDGSLSLVEKVPTGGTVMPLAISPNHEFLYASLRSEPYSVSSFSIDPKNGKLDLLSTVPLADNMANLATDKSGHFLLAASYLGNKISVNPIGQNGEIKTPPVEVINTGKNAHAIATDPSNTHLFASNLGSDVILQFKFDSVTGRVTPNTPPSVATKAGAGPRHFVFDTKARFVYSTNELDGTLNTYRYDAVTGTMTLLVTDSLLPPDFKGGALAPADIHLTPDGRFLYASERTSSTLTGFSVNPDSGKLTLIGSTRTETQPRGFNIDPSGRFLLAVGQKSNGVSSYAIDQETGTLKLLHQYPVGKNPNWVEMIELK
ncbi:lactonase family protein [Glaciimonas soli]|uniref:Beta-propeller fold lactonase family protein n=1 Tax=Glaciimonas soli TaxID=2590999 RepID=A0A843YW52_9BURK|nr:beta-propeller fold lactonase family protein [Glaciimonas soli]MQR01904.1 beta-propeller fold lactonase family protein [Glaciimonas soli]